MFELVVPGLAYLDGYAAALERGWSSSTTQDVSAAQLAQLRADPMAFVANMARTDGGTIVDPDGSSRERIPGRILWMWDGEFCGSINLRYLPGTEELPPTVSGHVGYAVVPWKQRLGYATRAVALMLPTARDDGLARVLITCDVDNMASWKVIEANGGVLVGEFPPMRKGEKVKLGFWVAT